MGFLDGFMGGGSSPTTIQTQTTNSAPWKEAQPYLKDVFSRAQTAFNAGGPNYYPHNTVVGFSPQTEQALNSIQNRAAQGSDLQRAGVDTATATARGDFLGANPFLTGSFNAAARPVVDQFMNNVAPNIDSSFAGAGRLGSGLYAQQRNSAENTLGRNFSDMAAKMAYGNYAQERQNQNAMAQAAPAIAQSDYADPSRLLQVGSAREGLEKAQMQDRINRYNFEQNKPWDNLARYQGMVNGGYGSSTQTATPIYSNPGANFLSGALGGAQLGKDLGLGAMNNRVVTLEKIATKNINVEARLARIEEGQSWLKQTLIRINNKLDKY